MLEATDTCSEKFYAVGWAENKPNLLYATKVLHEKQRTVRIIARGKRLYIILPYHMKNESNAVKQSNNFIVILEL